MLPKTWFLLLYLLSNVELEFVLMSWFHDTKSWICLGFALDLSDIGLLDRTCCVLLLSLQNAS